MEDIAIPMLHGNMEDIANETSTVNSSESNLDSSVGNQQQYEREKRITIDYGLLPENLKDIEEEDIKKNTDKLTKSINDLQGTIQRIQAPNMKVRNSIVKHYKLNTMYMWTYFISKLRVVLNISCILTCSI